MLSVELVGMFVEYLLNEATKVNKVNNNSIMFYAWLKFVLIM